MTSVDRFMVGKICHELPFNQELQDSRENRCMVDRSIVIWAKSCAFLMHGDHERRFPFGGKVPYWTERSNIFCQEY